MLTQEQIELRRSGVGGSDAPAIAGIDPYRQALDVYHQKLGMDEMTEPPNEAKVAAGNRMEPYIADWWADTRGMKCRRRNEMLRHPDFSFMLGHIDRKVVGDKAGLEIKNRGQYNSDDYGPNGTDQVKQTDIIQCQHYLAVTGWDLWHMAVLVDGWDLRWYEIPKDQGLIDSLIDMEYKFWQLVKKQTPPDVDFAHRSTPGLIQKLYPGTNGETVLLPDRALQIAHEMDELNEHKKVAEKRLKALKAERDLMLGESAVGLLPGGSGGWRRKLIERKGYEVKPSEYYDIRFSAKLKEAA